MVARETKAFAKFAPVLEEWVALTREACSLIDASRPAYDVRPFQGRIGKPHLCAISAKKAWHCSKLDCRRPAYKLQPCMRAYC